MSFRRTRSRAARALAAYMESRIATLQGEGDLPAEWEGMAIQLIEGAITEESGELKLPESFEELQFPALVIGCTRAREHDMGNGYLVCDVMLMVVTQLDEEDAPRKHDVRIGLVSSQLLDRTDDEDPDRESLDIVAEEISPPAAGPDTRKVKDFTCFGFGGLEEEGSELGRRVLDSIKIECHCQGTDEET